MSAQFSPVQLVLPIAMMGGVLLAGFAGMWIAGEDYFRLILIAAGVAFTGWAIVGRHYWWVPIFFLTTLGGHFYFGFKIYAHELAVLVCLLPLVAALAMNKEDIIRRKFVIPAPVIILFIYLCLHLLGILVYNKVEQIGGLGNVMRRYADALWPFLIFLPFLFVGNTKYLRIAFHLMAVAALIRFCFGMYVAFFGNEDTIIFVPMINFVPAGGFGGDLRISGSILTTVALCYFCMYPAFWVRLLLVPLIGVGIWGTFMGGGRITVVLLFGLFAFLFLIYRRFGALILWAGLLVVGVVFVNAEPEVLNKAPETVKRAATAFMFDRQLAADKGATTASDLWHARLQEEGFKSWSESFLTIMLGRGTGKFEERAWAGGRDFEGMVEMAIATSRFEKGLWDVLCTFGAVGMALYAAMLFLIIKNCFPILLRDQVKTPTHAFMFMATYLCFTWFLLCWISHSFPSREILFGMIALIAAADLKQAREEEEARNLPAPASEAMQDLQPAGGSLFRQRQRMLASRHPKGRFVPVKR